MRKVFWVSVWSTEILKHIIVANDFIFQDKTDAGRQG
jgi:hypothetical protein